MPNHRHTTLRMVLLYERLNKALDKLMPLAGEDAAEAPQARAASAEVALVNLLARDARRCLSRLPDAGRVRLLPTDGSVTRQDALHTLEQVRAALPAFRRAYRDGAAERDLAALFGNPIPLPQGERE